MISSNLSLSRRCWKGSSEEILQLNVKKPPGAYGFQEMSSANTTGAQERTLSFRGDPSPGPNLTAALGDPVLSLARTPDARKLGDHEGVLL